MCVSVYLEIESYRHNQGQCVKRGHTGKKGAQNSTISVLVKRKRFEDTDTEGRGKKKFCCSKHCMPVIAGGHQSQESQGRMLPRPPEGADLGLPELLETITDKASWAVLIC